MHTFHKYSCSVQTAGSLRLAHSCKKKDIKITISPAQALQQLMSTHILKVRVVPPLDVRAIQFLPTTI